jgi:hypothetical protein
VLSTRCGRFVLSTDGEVSRFHSPVHSSRTIADWRHWGHPLTVRRNRAGRLLVLRHGRLAWRSHDVYPNDGGNIAFGPHAFAGPRRQSCGVNGICEPTSKRAPGPPFILLGHLRRTKSVYARQAFSFDVSPRMIPGLYGMYLYCRPCGNSLVQSGDRLEGETIRVTRKPEAHHFRVGTTPQRIRFLASEPLGVILRFRLTVPHGLHVTATGRIPHLAGVQVSTDRTSTCRRHGAVDVCTQPEEWCPMPAAARQFVLQKKSGRAGEIRLDFIIGSPPHG